MRKPNLLVVSSFLFAATFLGACGVVPKTVAPKTPEEKVIAMMQTPPFIAPMGSEDITEPQSGYFHQPASIDGGELLYFKSGSSKAVGKSTPAKVEFKNKILLLGEDQDELVPGFKPGFAMCSFDGWDNKTWTCGIFQSSEDAEKYTKSYETSPVPSVICKDCKPTAIPGWTRSCPGYYVSWLNGKQWEDKLMPAEKFNDEGNCTFDKPWWMTKEGLKLGVEKWGEKLKEL